MAAKVFLVAGLGYGDEGKGSIINHLVRQHHSSLVVRYNGGAQASHAVVTEEGRDHRFSQFGSGTFAGARTFLSRYMLFNPMTLLSEAKGLEGIGVTDPLSRIVAEKSGLVTTPFHMAVNRIREIMRGDGRHGSCGMGIGETMRHHLGFPSEAVHVMDMENPDGCRWKLRSYRKRFIEELATPVFEFTKEHGYHKQLATEWEMLNDVEFMDEVVEKFAGVAKLIEIVDSAWLHDQLTTSTVVFEGAQGVLLDQDYGWAPYNTWSDCTFGNAEKLLMATGAEVIRIGVLRGYMTRHGAGPFVTEDPEMTAPGDHNCEGPWQKNFRVGHFDPLSTRYALEAVGGVDYLALTCLDHLKTNIRSSTTYTTRVGEERERNGLSKSTWDGIPVQRPREFNDPFHMAQQHRQEEMGKILSFMRPVYQQIEDVDSFIAHVEKETKTPVKLCSFGPKASDKRPR